MAEAYLAKRAGEQGETVVLKRMRPDFADSQAFLRRFVLEAQVASRLAHPNLVRFQEFGRVGDCHYIVMDHVRGHSLHRLMDKSFEVGARLSPAGALHLGTGLLEGLSAMHRVEDKGHPRPMLHRDVTPSNVIVDPGGTPVLIDFGIAKDVNGPSITLPGQVIGTARYMAPEHRRAEYIDARADVFSVSVVLFELFFARHPWPPLRGMKELLRTTFDPPELSEELRRTVPPTILSILTRGLSCAPEDRWADAEHMRRALQKAAKDTVDLTSGPSEARQWIRSLRLPRDEALTSPVIDHSPPEGREQEVMWSASGSVGNVPSTVVEAEIDSAVLTIPPLPPRRDAGVDLVLAEAEALGRPGLKMLPWLVAGLALCAACAAYFLRLV